MISVFRPGRNGVETMSPAAGGISWMGRAMFFGAPLGFGSL